MAMVRFIKTGGGRTTSPENARVTSSGCTEVGIFVGPDGTPPHVNELRSSVTPKPQMQSRAL